MDPPLCVWEKLIDGFQGLDEFKEEFTKMAMENDNGYTWLLWDYENQKLVIENTKGSWSPFTEGVYVRPILCCDTWEHAYYIDHRDDKSKYLHSFWSCVNWNFVE